MKRATFIIISVILLLVIIISIFLIYNPKPSSSPKIEECKTISYYPNAGINLVFLSDKNTAEKYEEALLEISPFKENPSSLNFYYVDYKPECELYQGIALLCYSQKNIKKASSCPNDIIIAVQEKPSNIRSSSYMQMLSLNSISAKTVFAHELAHSLANLAEEYTPASIPRKSRNCQKECSFEIKDGCWQGCSDSSYYRSIDRGIMRTLSSSDFGKFDSSIIEEIIKKPAASITGKAAQNLEDCENKRYYLIQGEFSNAQIKIQEKSIEQGCPGTNGNGGFQYNLILEDSSSYSGNFNPEFIFTDIQDENLDEISGEVYQSDKPFILKIPVVETAESLEISSDGIKLAEINLKDISRMPCKIE